MRVVVDSDLMAYACGFAAQKTVYFEPNVPEIVAEPVENALALARHALEAIYDDVMSWLSESGEKVDHLELYLTGKDNFRDKVATIRPYKGNRINKPKPVHWQAIRDYMVNVWGAKVVNGYEADDEVAIQAALCGYDPDRIAIASVDKDLKTVPGLLYSFRKKEAYMISPEEALLNEYRQCLMGDASDNIVGCYRCGTKTAEKLIQPGMDPASMWATVLAEFKASVMRDKCPYTDPDAAALETMRLVHMLRTPDDVWSPPL